MLITVGRYSTSLEAHIAKSKLASEGIPAFLADENTINMQWLYSDAIGGVKLQVPEVYLEQAFEALCINHSEDLLKEQGQSAYVCSKCGHHDVSPITRGKRMAFIVFLFFHFPFWPFKRQILCNNCGAKSDVHA